MLKKIFLCCLLFSSLALYPCGNEYGHTLDGQRIYSSYFFLRDHHRHFDKVLIQERMAKLQEKIAQGSATYKTWSDLALNLMKLGQSDSALAILKPLARKHPQEYNITANLGTCYELKGKLDSALKYISLGLAKNPDSHRGSEWIHVKILEGKIMEKRFPGWMSTNAIIPLESLIAKLDSVRPQRDIRKINDQFNYQLHTRIPFTPAPNKTIANLLVSLGDFNTEVGTYENAILAYAYAVEFQESFYLQRKIKEKIESLNRKNADLTTKSGVPTLFLHMMQRSTINPDMLLMGLDDFAAQLDSSARQESHLHDRLHALQERLDSLLLLQKQGLIHKEMEFQAERQQLFLYFGIAFVVGIGLTLLLLTKRKAGGS